eukprot:SAG11_NODE_11261_length_773_cov_0.943620_1_plen_51_part_00
MGVEARSMWKTLSEETGSKKQVLNLVITLDLSSVATNLAIDQYANFEVRT